MSPLDVLVTGATGNQGGHVARRLLHKGHKVRAFTRKPHSPAALALVQLGAEIATGTFADRGSLETAMRGVDAVYGMGTPYEAGPDTETREGLALVDAAQAARVGHLVYSSVGDADRETGIPHFESKRAVERHLEASGVPHTIVAPVFFAENLFGPGLAGGLKQGVYSLAMPADRKLQLVTLDDLSGFAVHVLENRAKYLSRRINIASDDLTGAQVAEILSRVTGRPIAFVQQPMEQVRAWSEDLAKMMEWFDRVGYSVNIAALRREVPEVDWSTFEDWARKQDWSALSQPVED